MGYPAINAFLLMTTCIPSIAMIVHGAYKIGSRGAGGTPFRLTVASSIWWLLALTCWINDKAFCQVWNAFPFPYPQLHSFWHVLVFLACYTACVLGAYFRARDEHPQLDVKLEYCPWKGFELGVPYVVLKEEVLVKAAV